VVIPAFLAHANLGFQNRVGTARLGRSGSGMSHKYREAHGMHSSSTNLATISSVFAARSPTRSRTLAG
jgi:hypothetical protein